MQSKAKYSKKNNGNLSAYWVMMLGYGGNRCITDFALANINEITMDFTYAEKRLKKKKCYPSMSNYFNRKQNGH